MKSMNMLILKRDIVTANKPAYDEAIKIKLFEQSQDYYEIICRLLFIMKYRQAEQFPAKSIILQS